RALRAGMFAMFRAASGSDRVAGVATVVYMLNPNFTFFDGQFAYETLALALVPLLFVGVSMLSRRRAAGPGSWIAVLGILATIIVTHHVTSFALLGMLATWLVIRLLNRRRDRTPIRPLV